MTRLGWSILAVIVVAVAAFASMLRIAPAGHGAPTPVASIVPSAPVADSTGPLGVPVAGVSRAAIRDSWGEARGGGTRAHHGTDIPAARGTPVVAAAPGTVEKLFQSTLGGITLYVRSPDRRWTYYYAHLAGYVAGLHEGQVIARGEPLGFVGDTGDAGPGNFHLHFGLTRTQPDEHWWQGTDVDAYPMLAGKGVGR